MLVNTHWEFLNNERAFYRKVVRRTIEVKQLGIKKIVIVNKKQKGWI